MTDKTTPLRGQIVMAKSRGTFRLSPLVGLVVKEGVILACAGLMVRLVRAYFEERALQSTLFGIGKFDLSAFAALGFELLATALLACYLPARRAASTEPMTVLRSE